VQREFARFAKVIWHATTTDPEVLTLAAESGIPHSDGKDWPEVDPEDLI
jgi:hypothetical protein